MDLTGMYPAFELWGGVFCLVGGVSLLLTGTKKGETGRRYSICMEFTGGMMLIADALAWLFRGMPGVIPRLMVYAGNFLSFLGNYWLPVILLLYICACFEDGKGDEYLAWLMPFVMVVSIFNTLLLIISQFNGMLYYIDEDNVYHRGSFLYFSWLFTGMSLAAFLLLLIKERKSLKKQQLLVLISLILIPGTLLAIQIPFYGYSLTNLGSAVCLAMLFIIELLRQKERLEKQTNDLKERDAVIREMQTSIALSQIKPHFLYNCLNTIYVLCGKNLELGRRGISDLSDYLRANIGSIDSRVPISFEKEKEHVIKYLDLEKLRFPDEFSYSFFTPVTDFTLPALTLQPLVENAVRHGVVPLGKDGIILITTRETDRHYVITVSDNGAGFDPEAPLSGDDKAEHIGIRNVRERLRRLSGGELEIQSVINYGTEAVIRIPKNPNSRS